jgi:hypothetical protein
MRHPSAAPPASAQWEGPTSTAPTGLSFFFRKYFDIENAPYGCPEGVGLPRRPMLPHRSSFEGSGDVRRKRTRLRVDERNQPSQLFRVSDRTVSEGLHVRSAII